MLVLETWRSFCAWMCLLAFTPDVTTGKKQNSESAGPMGDQMERHKIFSNPLTKGVFVFDADGYLPEEPLKQLRKIHMNMMKTIGANEDMTTRSKYLVTLSNSANADIKLLRTKLQDSGITSAADLVKTQVKGDAFMLMLSHAALVCNAILYFPDIMHSVVRNNPDLATNFKWVIHFSVEANLTLSKVHLKLFDLAQQEIGLIPKKENYKNPFKNYKPTTTTPAPTTKKPRKRLERGPRLYRGGGGEL